MNWIGTHVFARYLGAHAGYWIRKAARWFSAQSRPLKVLEITVIGVPLLFILVSIGLQAVNPGHNPLHNAISELVRGPYGITLNSVFYLLAFSIAVLVFRLFRKPGTTLRYKLGVGIISLCAVGFVLLGVFPTDAPGEALTRAGSVHMQTTAAIIILFPVACFLLAPGLRKGFRRGWLSVLTHSTGVTQLVLITVAAVLVMGNLGWVGMVERMLMINSLGWMQLVSIQTMFT